MRPDRELVRQVAAERRFGEGIVEKALCLLALLQELTRHPYLKSRLVLKGGTALNLFYWDCPRLSVDVDLNYTGAVAAAEMRDERPELFKAIEAVAEAEGYRPQLGSDDYANRTVYLWYDSVLGARDHLQVDVNFLMRVCLFDTDRRAAVLQIGASQIEFPLVAIEEVMAGKLVALLDRGAPRDLYDCYTFVLHGKVWNEQRLRQAYVVLGSAGLPRPLWDYGADRLARVTEEQIERQLWPLLTEGAHPDIGEMHGLVSPLVSQLVDLREEERRFVEGVLEGELNPEPLCPGDHELEDRIRSHPALLWKLQNVREWRARTKQ